MNRLGEISDAIDKVKKNLKSNQNVGRGVINVDLGPDIVSSLNIANSRYKVEPSQFLDEKFMLGYTRAEATDLERGDQIRYIIEDVDTGVRVGYIGGIVRWVDGMASDGDETNKKRYYDKSQRDDPRYISLQNYSGFKWSLQLQKDSKRVALWRMKKLNHVDRQKINAMNEFDGNWMHVGDKKKLDRWVYLDDVSDGTLLSELERRISLGGRFVNLDDVADDVLIAELERRVSLVS
jgi:hypothetical protein